MAEGAPTFVTASKVREVLRYEDLIPVVEKALVNFSAREEGGVNQPLRSAVPVQSHGTLLVMPGFSAKDSALATKLVSIFPENEKLGLPNLFANILLFNSETGELQAIMDGEVITGMRTAAASAVATKYLSNKDAKVLCILGSGVQARTHVHALKLVRNFTETLSMKLVSMKEPLHVGSGTVASGKLQAALGVPNNTFNQDGTCLHVVPSVPWEPVNIFLQVRVWSRTPENAQKCAKEVGAKVCATVEEAVRDADVIVTVTFATTPILFGKWVKPGALINSVGAPRPNWRELDDDIMLNSFIVADSVESATNEAGDVVLSKAKVAGELGEVISGKLSVPKGQTMIFKSLGMAVEDVVSAKLVYDKLKSTGKLSPSSL